MARPRRAARNGNGTIFRVDQWGHFKTLYSFPNDTSGNPVNGAFPIASLTVGIECSRDDFARRSSMSASLANYAQSYSTSGSHVTLYGVTYSGGVGNSGVAFSFNVATSTYTILWTFTGGTDGANPNGKVLTSFDGHIYGLTAGGGATGNGVVYAIGGVLPSNSFPLLPARPVHRIH